MLVRILAILMGVVMPVAMLMIMHYMVVFMDMAVAFVTGTPE